MKLQLRVIDGTYNTIDKLSHVKMSPKAAYTIMKYIRCAKDEVVAFNAVKMPLMKKYGEQVSDGRYTIPKVSVDDFMMEYGPLLDTEVDIPVDKIKLSDIHGDVSPDELMDLEFLIDGNA